MGHDLGKIVVLGLLGRTTNQRKTLALGRVQGRRSLAEVACFGPEIVNYYSVIYSIIKVQFKDMFIHSGLPIYKKCRGTNSIQGLLIADC